VTDRPRPGLAVAYLLGPLALLAGCQPAAPKVAAVPAVAAPVQAFPTVAAPQPAAYAERRILVSVQFGLGDSSIHRESILVLDALAEALNNERLRGVSYEINGHTDLSGNFAHNIALSGLRAKAVSDYLRTHGVETPPIRAQGFGPLQLLHPHHPFSPENRRVEIVALGPFMTR
jgi:outer membrane protein OmpA-like peptidoglycan-associated protein